MNDENDADSSDSEGERNYTSDEDEELSFESDDEGNFQQNTNKVHKRKGSENDSDFIDGDEEDEGEDEESSDDDAEDEGGEEDDDDEGGGSELSFEDDSEDEEDDDDEEEEVEENGDAAAPSTSRSKPTTNGTNSLQSFRNELNGGKSANGEDEYKHDTDDEEDIRNTVGNIPMNWYDEYKHIGYDWNAKKIIKPAKGDMLDDFLRKMEDPDFWRTVKDPQTGQEVVLSEADIDLIKRINSQRIPDADYDDYAVKMISFAHSSETLNIYVLIFSRGSTGSRQRWRKCQFATFRTINGRLFRPCPRRRRCPNWCTHSRWDG